MNKKIHIIVILFFLNFLFFVPFTNAARFFFETDNKEVGLGQEMEIVLRVDSEGEMINALEGTIYLPELLSVEAIHDGDTLIAFWSERPYLNNDQMINFSGIMPGGWWGRGGKVFSFIARTINQGEGTIVVSNARILLHDGKGTELPVSTESLALHVDEEIALIPVLFDYDDDELPELFTPLLAQDSDVFEGDYFLVFATQDKGSGIDYYEVQETKKRLKDKGEGNWQKAESPYRIIDQTLESFIYIRAIDRAGNIRVVVFEPTKRPDRRLAIMILALFIILFLFALIIINRRRKIRSILISIVWLFVLPVFSQAASLYFSPSSGSYTTGEQFPVKVLVSSSDVKMNAVGADISFSSKNLELISISETISLINMWGEKPSFSNKTGRISFEGLILDGYQGLSGEIVTLIFRARSPGKTAVRFSSGSVLAYNGLGTSILSGFQHASFVIKGKPVSTPEILEKIPEQLFDISVRLEKETIAEASELEAVIVFESFGKVPTLIDLTYTIVNDQKQIVFKDDIETVFVETETVLRKRFSNLNLLPGSYTLVVKTQYNVDVIDEFRLDFTIVEEVKKEILFDNIWFWIWLITLLIAIIIFLFNRFKKQ